MTITQQSSVTELVLAKIVGRLMGHYQWSAVLFLPFARFEDISQQPTDTFSFVRPVKDAHTDLANESTSLTPVEYETTAVDVSVSRLGIAREPTETALEDTVLGRADFIRRLVADAARLLGEATEEDYAALFASAANNVTDTGAAMTIADLVAAKAKQRVARVHGRSSVFNLSHAQIEDLQDAQSTATATPWMTFYQPSTTGDDFGGYVMGSPVFSSALCASNSSAADKIGCLYARGDVDPEWCALGYVSKREPVVKFDESILADTLVMASIARRGVGMWQTNFATKIVTAAS